MTTIVNKFGKPEPGLRIQQGKTPIHLQLTCELGSYCTFYVNGKSQGIAFHDLYQGIYYPSVSLYFDATVHCNFGPTFTHPPTDVEVKPTNIQTIC